MTDASSRPRASAAWCRSDGQVRCRTVLFPCTSKRTSEACRQGEATHEGHVRPAAPRPRPEPGATRRCGAPHRRQDRPEPNLGRAPLQNRATLRPRAMDGSPWGPDSATSLLWRPRGPRAGEEPRGVADLPGLPGSGPPGTGCPARWPRYRVLPREHAMRPDVSTAKAGTHTLERTVRTLIVGRRGACRTGCVEC